MTDHQAGRRAFGPQLALAAEALGFGEGGLDVGHADVEDDVGRVAFAAADTVGATGPIVGYEGLCLDDRGASTAEFNPIQVYTCNGTDAQDWTIGSGNTLQVLGMCLDVDAAGTTDGTLVDLYTCNGTGAQIWVPQPGGALLNPNSGKCLDDPGSSTTAGTQLEIWDCNGGSNQDWILPT